jgi:phosphoglycolate phosphatase
VKQVLLFDIDGTLINTSGAGGAALNLALHDEFGISEPKKISLSGRTDRGIALELFEFHRIEPTESNWTKFRTAYLARLRDLLPHRQGIVLPGVRILLRRLATASQTAMGLLTGNVFEGARHKLEHFGLFEHFRFGGFGDEHPCRDDVARAALRSVHDHHGEDQERQVWVIGDTPLDIRCARAIGAKVIAVATGHHSVEELASHSPDFAVATLEDPAPWQTLLPVA